MGLGEIRWTPEDLEKVVQNWLNYVKKVEDIQDERHEWENTHTIGDRIPPYLLSDPLDVIKGDEFNELGYDWNLPGLYETTEMNGTHYWSITIKDTDDLWKKGAAAIAKKLFEASQHFPGWRNLYADINAHYESEFFIRIYGGKRDWGGGSKKMEEDEE